MSKPDGSIAGPVSAHERIQFVDVLRGFAVLGILFANMPLMSMAGPLTWDDHFIGASPTRWDHFAFWFVRLFADTKFVTTFSLLFGAGLAIMWERAERRGAPFTSIYLRRLAVLAAIGAIHGLFLWFGDILTHYATVGFVAMWLRRLSPRQLTWLGSGLVVLGGLPFIAISSIDPTAWEQSGPPAEELMGMYADVFSSGDFARMLGPRAELYLGGLVFVTLLWGARTLGLFLLGMALVKQGIFKAPRRHRSAFKAMLVVGLVAGIPLNVALYWLGGRDESAIERCAYATVFYACGLALAPGYIACIAFWAMGSFMESMRSALAAVGRMALTNYLAHSVITAVIFNYCGQFDRWGRFAGLLLTVGIFVAQLILSPLWLRRFRFGPLEWLWRSLTYGTLQPFLRA